MGVQCLSLKKPWHLKNANQDTREPEDYRRPWHLWSATIWLVIKSYKGYCQIYAAGLPHRPYIVPMPVYWARD